MALTPLHPPAPKGDGPRGASQRWASQRGLGAASRNACLRVAGLAFAVPAERPIAAADRRNRRCPDPR